MAIKNLWSLNIDELLVANEVKGKIKDKQTEVFFPLNSQLKGIDLVLVNLQSKKTTTVQVKGSRTYVPTDKETGVYGEGSTTWFIISKKEILDPKNNADFYIFVLHCLKNTEHKKDIEIQYLVLPMQELKNICKRKATRKRGTQYHFFIWIDLAGKRAFDINYGKKERIQLQEHLNNWRTLFK